MNGDNNSIIHNSKPQQDGIEEVEQQPQPEQPPYPLLSSSNGNANESSRITPAVLRKVGEKTPPGTLKKSLDRPASSCKSWCEQYSQTFLAKTIDTPLPDPGPYSEDED